MEFLKTILGDELFKQVKAAIEAHNGKDENKEKPVKIVDLSTGEYTSVNKYNDEVTARTNAEKQLSSAQELIQQLQNGNSKLDDTTAQKIKDYEASIQKLTAELNESKLNSAIAEALRGAKGVDLDYLAFKLKAMDGELKLGDDGKIKGIDDKIATLKTQFPTQFGSSDPASDKQIDPQPLPKGSDDKKAEPTNLNSAVADFYENNKN